MNNNLYISFNAITCSHNYSISLLYNGDIFAIELERINRIKDFPQGKISRMLPLMQREMFSSIDNYTENRDEIISFRNYLDSTINDIIKKQKINWEFIDKIYTLNFPFDISIRGYEYKVINYKYNYHHLFHACSTYYPSQFNEAVILCMDHDGYDEEIEGGKDVMHTIWYARGNDIKILYYDEYDLNNKKIGIGEVYEMHSGICGIGEGTLMGLSGYGNNRLSHINIFNLSNQGVLLDESYFKNRDKDNKIENNLEDIIIENFRKNYGIDGKGIKENIEKSIYADISNKVQSELERAILFLAKKCYELTGCKNICIAGGVGLNILANNRILRELEFENIFVQPACNDSGISLGGLYYMYHNILGNTKRIYLNSPGLGLEYLNDDIKVTLDIYKEKIKYTKLGEDKYIKIAKILKNNNIIGLFQGRGEFGPRALGFRSILASPILKNMKNKVNKIKEREYYRPLAPIMLEDDFREYLDTDYPSPYMTLVSFVCEEKKEKIPSVVHIDGTARYQTVNQNQNLLMYNLLKEFKNQTGISVLINTSFNQHNEPIVETPEDALKMFLATDLDYLFIGDYLVSKDKKYLEYSFNNKEVNEKFANDLNQLKNTNFRGYTLLKILGISKLGFNYHYEIGDRGINFKKGELSFTIELLKYGVDYNFIIGEIGIIVNNIVLENKLFNLLKIVLEKNHKLIYNLIKGI